LLLRGDRWRGEGFLRGGPPYHGIVSADLPAQGAVSALCRSQPSSQALQTPMHGVRLWF
jgi:hypothetical protein